MTISPQGLVSRHARIGADVSVGPFSIVHDAVDIGAGSRIGAYCEIGVPTPLGRGEPLRIGSGAHIRSHSVLHQASCIGSDFESGHHVILRERTRVGRGVRIGTLSDIQGDCNIGDYVRMHSSVFVAKLSAIRDFAWLLPRVVLTNDPTPPVYGTRAA